MAKSGRTATFAAVTILAAQFAHAYFSQTMAQSHEQALTKLSEQTRNTITEVERIVGAAGLDPKRLVPHAGDARKQSRGGPFVPWSARRASPRT